MKVSELKKLLETVDDERVVIMSRDSEGNGYSPLASIDGDETYLAETTWSGEIGLAKGVPAFVMWPTN